MQQVCKSSADRINNLPADVIHHILVFLPIKDAAKTSVLSRKWRHQWRSMPQLVFDYDFVHFCDVAESEWKATNKQVMLTINQCLLLHDGPIAKFELSINGLAPCHEIGLITLFLSKIGVQNFTLALDDPEDEDDADVKYYQIHSSLFSALHLKSLTLQYCEFTPPSWFVGFNKLIHLELEHVILPCDFFESFLPKCPMLEYLKVDFCKGLAGNLEIVAPFLKSFSYRGSLDVYFKSTPLLSEISLHYRSIPDMVALLASLPGLQRFQLNYLPLKKLAGVDTNAPTRLPAPLHRLNSLCIDWIVFDGCKMERVFVCLIISSPNLRRLRVSDSKLDAQPINNEVSSLWRLLEAEVCAGSSDCLKHLREFRLEFSYGTHAELDLVRFVLATAPLLQSIYVWPHYTLGMEKNTEFMKEVMRYKRVSKEAEITYDWKYKKDSNLSKL